MTDLSNLLQPKRTSFRHMDVVAANMNEIVAGYADDQIEWDAMLVPMQTPNGVMFGLMVIVTMPAPIIGSNQRFVMQYNSPDLMAFHDLETVRKAVFEMVLELKNQHAEYLRGNN